MTPELKGAVRQITDEVDRVARVLTANERVQFFNELASQMEGRGLRADKEAEHAERTRHAGVVARAEAYERGEDFKSGPGAADEGFAETEG